VIISRLTNDVQALDQLVTDGVVTLFGSTLTLIGTAVDPVVLDLELALLTFLVFPSSGSRRWPSASSPPTRTGSRARRSRRSRPTCRRRCRASAWCGPSPRSSAISTASPELNDENRDANMKTVNLNAAYFPSVELLSGLATAGILLYGGYQAIEGEVTVGVLVAFIAALNNFFDPIQSLSQFYTTYQAGMAALDKIFELLDEEPELSDAPDAVVLDRLRGEIEFDDVSFTYGSGEALCHVSLHVPPGQTVALVGATGAGQIDLRQARRALPRPDAGAVLVDGHDLRDVHAALAALADGHRAAGGVPVQRDDRENIAFGRADADADDRGGGRARSAPTSSSALPTATTREVGERGVAAVGRAAPARGLRARADRRPAHPRARRGDLERRHPHGGAHRGRAAAAARRAHGDRHRPPPLDHPARRPDRRARPRRDREQGTHEELLDARGAYWRLHRDWAEQAAA
jgi:ATP-binding cassette subfamily B protein